MTYKKKLIEVALPLEAINVASAREKSIRHGHPSTLHLWWARRPLATCRAVLFASLVDDPSAHPEKFKTEKAQEKERQRLFRIIEELVKWENSNNETVLEAAREEIRKSTGGNPPPVLDPFCGGGSIPLEAQRLGLEAHGSDLNPVAVLITKALIEIPPKFAGNPPVNPESRGTPDLSGKKPTKVGAPKLKHMIWNGAQGLAEDVRYYGQWMRDEAYKRIGHLYPKVKLPKDSATADGGEATVIAWLWARTVKCPNPACGAMMPLVRSFTLSLKAGKQAWVEPIVDKKKKTVQFEVRTGKGIPQDGTKLRGKARCLLCGTDNISDAELRSQSKAFGIGSQLLSVVVEGKRSRIYVNPSSSQLVDVKAPKAPWLDQPLPDNARWFSPPGYGMTTYSELFTPRQLVALTTFSDLVAKVREKVLADAAAHGMRDDRVSLDDGGTGATAYADAVATYLAFAVDKGANYWSTICAWHSGRDIIMSTFARQALPMVWDYAETNPVSTSTGNFMLGVEQASQMMGKVPASPIGFAKQLDATASINGIDNPLICTDPPYYDNIGYADLSDFFYVWLRHSLKSVYPKLFSTLLTPKAEELVATPYRFNGDKKAAQVFFEEGLGIAFSKMRQVHDSRFPMPVFYAFKQSEEDEGGDDNPSHASTGWETMLEGLLKAGFVITGTWPMRTELVGNLKKDVSALASSVVIACRPRPDNAPLATRREFINALKKELPDAILTLCQANIAPVDLAQASIGPGMAVFSRYAKVMEADGNPMTVRSALGLINLTLDEVTRDLTDGSEGGEELDSYTRWALAWFEQNGHNEGSHGDAEELSKAKNVGVNGLVQAGIVYSRAGKVRLLKREELDPGWDPKTDKRVTMWEVTQHLIRALQEQGESGAAELLQQVGGELGEKARDLAYRLYLICDRKKWASEALAYNSLVIAWSGVKTAEVEVRTDASGEQQKLGY
jgi:putative DNA methylase